MEKIINNLFIILLMNGSILLFPGVNFLLIARNAVINGFFIAFCCAIGVSTAILFHATLAAFSISMLLKKFPLMFSVIRYAGGIYLFYLATQFLISFINKNQRIEIVSLPEKKKTEAIRCGFLVDILNPFVSIFYLSLFSLPTMHASYFSKPILELSLYILVILLVTLAWFTVVARFFATHAITHFFQNKIRYINIFTAIAMYYFSIKVIIGI